MATEAADPSPWIARREVMWIRTAVITVALLGLGLAWAGCTKTPEQLVADLGDPQTLVQEKARQALGEMGREAMPYLIEGMSDEAARANCQAMLIEMGEDVIDDVFQKADELCMNDEHSPTVDALYEVLLATCKDSENGGDVLKRYVEYTKEHACNERRALELLLAIEPPKDDVTVDPGENLRYKPMRFAYKADPDLATSRALARVCLYDTELGDRVADMNRDKDEEIYWKQWRLHDPLVRANLARYLNEDIWGVYHDNFIPDILREELKADKDDPLAQLGLFATRWRDRLDGRAIEPLPKAQAGLKAYYDGAAPGTTYDDEACLVFTAMEDIGKEIRKAMAEDEKRQARNIARLDEYMAALKVDKDAYCGG